MQTKEKVPRLIINDSEILEAVSDYTRREKRPISFENIRVGVNCSRKGQAASISEKRFIEQIQRLVASNHLRKVQYKFEIGECAPVSYRRAVRGKEV